MKSFQPRAETAPPDDEDPGDPPSRAAADHPPADIDPETDPMPRPSRQNRNAEVDFQGEKRSNGPHASATDQDARLCRKSPGTGAALCFMGHALMENRSGVIVQGDLTRADGHAERRAALGMIHDYSPGVTRQLTFGVDEGYDSAGVVRDPRRAWFRAETIPRIVSCRPSPPHVARKARHAAIDGRTIRHGGYALSRKHRKRIEEPFGWAGTVGGLAQTVYGALDGERPAA